MTNIVVIILQFIPGFIGSLLSLRFIDGSSFQKFTAFLLGVTCSRYIGGWIIEYLMILQNSMAYKCISFVCGLFGFAIVMHAYNQIPEIFKILLDWFKNMLNNFMPKGK